MIIIAANTTSTNMNFNGFLRNLIVGKRDDSSRYVSILSDHLHLDGLRQFQQDKATPHASRVATKWLQEHSSDFRHFHWPPKSPEMNIIEEIRDALLHDVEKRSPPPRTPMDLLTALQDSWCEKPPGCLQTLDETMTRRVAALLRVRGGPTRN
ncbi:hypothetical protein AVEN_101121-1 [Araneus ventricosus]|uniref:Tc1-like transposase DDE domain-containing protein n=1 Tax=Araneus ventricosus TaxID=182803 RepID=A0A4Y2R0R6_ARAVE|nr:hypothetical protein AVEN_101121-1 [Araneus ventricosus]